MQRLNSSRFAMAILSALAITPVASAQTPVLNVLTYDSFASEWGPGPQVERGFEETCGCDLRFIPAGDGAALLARLRLEGARSEADVVLGLDTNLMAAAAATELFVPHGISAALDLPIAWQDPSFLPFDWGWFALVYDRKRLNAPPTSFEDLAASSLKVVIQDPRSSTPGLGLLYWVQAAYPERAAQIWADLADNILTVTPGWTESYDLFLKGEADAVLSYTTSPAYHSIAEGDDSKAAAIFSEGHYLQVEVAGLLKSSKQPDLARKFLDYLISDPVQAIIPETNWMYPAKPAAAGLPEGFERLPKPQKTLHFTPDAAQALRGQMVEDWRAALSR